VAKTLRDGRYTIVRVLGEGSQGATFEATDARDGKCVAVKRFAVRNAKGWKEVELAEREARVLASLSHPKLPGYVEHFEEGGALYLVMERIAGVSLPEYRKRGAVFREEDAVRLLEEASGVLAYLHSRTPPIIHRDLKPGNVIRRPDGSFAFVDFGAVKDRLRQEGGSTIVGTFGYMAPEQFQGRALPQSDVYSIGATVLWMLTGEEPEKLPHRGLKIDVAAALGKRVSPTLVTILNRMLEPDPEARPASIAPFLAGFEVRGEVVRERPVPKLMPSEVAAPPAPDVATTSDAEGPVGLPLFKILRRFLPILWVMSGLAWWWLPWTIAMGFSVGLAILSLATSEYAPKGGIDLGRGFKPRTVARFRSVRIAEPELLVKRRVAEAEPVPLAEDTEEARASQPRKGG
jgi:serine/threonine protein kinase